MGRPPGSLRAARAKRQLPDKLVAEAVLEIARGRFGTGRIAAGSASALVAKRMDDGSGDPFHVGEETSTRSSMPDLVMGAWR